MLAFGIIITGSCDAHICSKGQYLEKVGRRLHGNVTQKLDLLVKELKKFQVSVVDVYLGE